MRIVLDLCWYLRDQVFGGLLNLVDYLVYIVFVKREGEKNKRIFV